MFPGSRLGPYEIIAELGSGGMAAVYQARQVNTGQQVAVKVVYEELADEAGREQFQREARLIARLEHPHILPVFDFDGQASPPYIVMRYLTGGTLKDAQGQGEQLRSPLYWRTGLRWVGQVAGALDYAHRQGIVHRDIKPSNILLDNDGNAFLADFGIALLANDARAVSPDLLVGTPLYTSPEQATGEGVPGPLADGYALAVVTFELFAGALPFEADSFEELLHKHAHTPPPPITKINPALPPKLDEIFAKALAKAPGDRYATAGAFAQALTLALSLTLTPTGAQRLSSVIGKLTEQNKVVTALYINALEYADIVDAHSGHEASRAALFAFWEQAQTRIEQHAGLVLEQGDTDLLALWGALTAHEEDAAQAVRAALAVQSALRAVGGHYFEESADEPLPLKIGVSTGSVLLTPDKTGEAHTATGATLATAKRLAEAALGEILIAASTHREVQGAFEMTVGETVKVRGRREPIATYRVSAAKTRTVQLLPRGVEGVGTQLIGREAELRQLQNAYLTATEDSETQLLTLLGAPGVGKSRLAAEFHLWLTQTPSTPAQPAPAVFIGRATPMLTARPYALWREVLWLRFQILDTDAPAVAMQKLETGLAQLVGPTLQMRHGETALPELAHLFGHLLGADGSAHPLVKSLLGEPQQLATRAREHFFRFMTLACAQQPLVLLLEDLHQADDASLDLLSSLVTELPNLRLLVVGLARPALLEQRPTWGSGRPAHKRLTLEALDKRASRDLVREILQKIPDVPRALRDLLVDRAEGNPLFMEELVKMLLEDRIIVKDTPEQWRVEESRLGHLRVPPSLAGLLQARFDTLLAPERLTLQRAAAVGRAFFDTALQAIDQADGTQLGPVQEILRRLVRREFIYPRESTTFAGATEYVFAQALVRDQIYESLLSRQRKVYHTAIAHWLARSERANEQLAFIAEHYERGGEPAQACAYFHRAAEAAFERRAILETCQLGERAMALVPPDYARLADLHFILGWGYGFASEAEKSITHYEKALALFDAQGSVDGRARVLYGLGLAWRYKGDYRVAEKHLRESLRLSDRASLWATKADALAGLGGAFRGLGDYAAERKCYVDSLALYQALPGDHRVSMAGAWMNLAVVDMNLGQYAAAEQEGLQAKALFESLGLRWDYAYCLNQLGFLASMQEKYAQAEIYLRESVEIAREVNNRWGIASGQNQLGYTYYYQQRWAEATAALTESTTLCREIRDVWGEAVCLVGLGLVAARAGQPEVARTHLREGLTIAYRIPVKSVMLDGLIGWALTEAQPENAVAWLALVQHHPATRQISREEAQAALPALQTRLTPDAYAATATRGATLNLEDVVAELIR